MPGQRDWDIVGIWTPSHGRQWYTGPDDLRGAHQVSVRYTDPETGATKWRTIHGPVPDESRIADIIEFDIKRVSP